MAQINGPKDASEERCVRRVQREIARLIRHRQLTGTFIPESLVWQGFIEPSEARCAHHALDNLASEGILLDHTIGYQYVVKPPR